VKLIGLQATLGHNEFQGEDTYVWVYAANLGTTPLTVTFSASTQAKGWTISSSIERIVLDPNRDSQVPVVGFLVDFNAEAESGSMTVCIQETGEYKGIDLTIYSSAQKQTAIAIARAIIDNPLHSQLSELDDKMNPTSAVRDFANSILTKAGLSQSSSEEDKAYAVYDYVIRHMSYKQPVLGIPSIDQIIKEMNQKGGVGSSHRVEGDCKTYTVFFGGLVRALGITVRPVAGAMEVSKLSGYALIGHAWNEIMLGGKWMFVDPTNELFVPRETLHSLTSRGYDEVNKRPWVLPDNLQSVSFDARKSYEFVADWGGPLIVLTYANGVLDITNDYRISPEPTLKEATLILTHSPVSLAVYDSKGNMLAKGEPYAIIFPGSSKPVESQMPTEGQYVMLWGQLLDEADVRLTGTGVGNYELIAAKISGGDIKLSAVHGSVSAGQIEDFVIRPSGDNVLEIIKRGGPNPFYSTTTFYLLLVAASAIILAIVSVFRRRKPRIKSVYPSPRIKTWTELALFHS